VSPARAGVVTVTLNAALDQTLECPGFAAGEVNRVRAQDVHAGGKGINVAAFLAGRAAVGAVTATGFLGRDNLAPFEALFARLAIRDRCLRVAGASRVNVKIVDRPGLEVTDLNLPGLAIPESDRACLLEIVDELAGDNRWFVLAGSLPQGVSESIYAELTTRLHARGALVAVDASGAALRHALAARPDLVKPNQHELAELLGRPVAGRAEVVQAARELHAGGVGLVVVSMGAEGAIFVDGERAVHAAPPPVEVVSTVGAGDAMVAGVLAARLAGGDLWACARSGTAFAAGTLTLPGPELPAPDRLAALSAAVRIESSW